MGEKPRLRKDPFSDMGQIGGGARKAKGLEGLPGGPVAQFGLFPEGKQGFLASRRCPLPRGFEHGLHAHVGGLLVPWGGGEGAVVADIPTQVRERDEELFGVGQKGAEAVIPQRARLGHHVL